MNNTVDPDRPLSSKLVASNPASASASIGAKANLTKLTEEHSSVLVLEWKERTEEMESSRATETWRHILNAVNKVGSPKTIEQCKDKIRNLKQAYKETRGNLKLVVIQPTRVKLH